MKNLFIIGWLAVLALISSCGDGGFDDPETEEPEAPVYLLKEVYVDNVLSHEFTYDAQNRIKKIVYYEDDDIINFILTYSASGDVASVHVDDDLLIGFVKNGTTITGTYGNGQKDVIVLNNQALPSKITYYDGDTDKYTYDADGNYLKDEYYSQITGSVTTYQYGYDDKKAPLYDCKTPRWFLVHWWKWGLFIEYENNINSLQVSPGSGTTSKYTYKYNAAGYAVSFEDGSSHRYNYTIK